MKRLLLSSLTLLVLSLTACGNPPSGEAPGDASYPSHPITIVVTFPPGGGTDLLARRIGASLQESLGQPVVVENRPGASGNIGARIVAESPPDGYTLLMVNSSFAINPGVYRNLGFSPKRDFAAVINVAFVPSVFVVPAASPLRNLDDVIVAAVPDKPLAFATCGNGTPQHLAGEMLSRKTGAVMQQVPYKGCGPALTDVMAGQVGVGVVTASSAAPLIAAGKLRALAVASPERFEGLPDVPTTKEAGFPGIIVESNYGVIAPTGTPKDIVDKMSDAIAKSLADPVLRQKMIDQGAIPVATTPDAYRTLMEAESKKWGEVIKRGKLGLQ
ncbi:MAG TPA: ABC transporter substrate-binding protein [Achromobacter sp.]|nr:ABC transporter substrate-binding protein [Achromobacter sp.]